MPILNSSFSGLKRPWTQVYIGLGGNIGNVVSSMVEALAALNRQDDIKVTNRSRLYKTPPWGDVDQDDFINACALIETRLEPEAFLGVIKKLEKQLKREKTRRWGPRTIDIDILIFGDVKLTSPGLEIPHPRMTSRGFVLMPMRDLDGEIKVNGQTIRHWLAIADLTGIETLPDQAGWTSG